MAGEIVKGNRLWARLMGLGIILLAVHNTQQPFIQYLFLPVIGLLLISFSVSFVIAKNYKHLDLGSKFVWIPLAILCASFPISAISLGVNIYASLCLGILFFGTYVTCRILGKEVYKPFAVAVIIIAISCVVYAIVFSGQQTGGLLSPSTDIKTGNYDISTGFLVFGAIVSTIKKQWLIALIAIVGILSTGALEGIFILAVLFIAILIRKDWGKKLWVGLAIIILLGGSWITLTDGGKKIFDYLKWSAKFENVTTAPDGSFYTESATLGRLRVISESFDRFKFFGNGYEMTAFTNQTVHNVPLIIVDEIGVIPALAWLFVVIYCLFKTKWRYAWIAFIAMCVFDHYLFTQVSFWFFTLVGVTTSTEINDRIFDNETKQLTR